MPNYDMNTDIFLPTDEEAAATAKRFKAPVPTLPKLYCVGHVSNIIEVKNGTNYNFVVCDIKGEYGSDGGRAKVYYAPHWFAPDADLARTMADAKQGMDALDKSDPEYKGYSSTYYTIKNNIMGDGGSPAALEAITGPYYGHLLAMLGRIDAHDNTAVLRVFRTFFATVGPISCGYKMKQSFRDGEPTKYYEIDGWWRPKTPSGEWNVRAFQAQADEVKKDQESIEAARRARAKNPELAVPAPKYKISYDVSLMA